MKNAKRYSEKLRQNYKILQQKEDLLIKLQNTNTIIQQNEAELAEIPQLKDRKTTEENIDNYNVTNKICSINEG